MFFYNSIESHGIITPKEKEIKETHIKIENNKGKKIVSIEDEKGVHSHTATLTKKEIRNIKNRNFMPTFFHKSLKHIRRKKNKTKTIKK